MGRLFLSLYLFLLGGHLGYWLVAELVLESRFQALDDALFLNQARGPLMMVAERLSETPVGQETQVMQQIARHFGTLIGLKHLPDLQLPQGEADLAQLREETIFILDDVLPGAGPIAYHLVPGTDRVLIYGPVEGFSGITRFDRWVQLGRVGVLTLFLLLWVVALYGKLRALRRATQAFGRGDFEARARLTDRGYLGELGRTFDRMAARIEELLKSKREMINAVSHELRTPLTRMKFVLHFLEKIPSQTKARPFLKDLGSDIGQLESLVEELLQYAHLEFTQSSSNLEAVDLFDWLRRVLPPYRRGHHKSLRWSFPTEAAHCMVAIEGRQLEKALGNLITNALRYADQRVELLIEYEDRWIWVHVDDDGPGIPEDQRARVLEPFTRLDVSRTRETGGVGLGAALALRIVQWQNGRLLVGESPLGGSRFSMGLPLLDEAPSEVHQAEATKR